jgi:hypothetical protein
MSECERLQTCPFFSGKIAAMPSVAELMKKCYCFGDKTKCARYQLVLAGLPVPLDLLPNDNEQASRLLHK